MAKKVLIIEDEESLRHMFASMLKTNGFEVETAENGELGFKKVKQWDPDLILLDLLMPVMDGYDVLKRLKSEDEGGHIPVIVLTSLSRGEEERKAKLLGADDFLRKDDVHLQDIIDKIGKLIGKKE
ncbi:response regulator [Patescibacteria group bacterium]|nr:response regulator [Patescibacteria group bacterium]MBU4511938.1 response regulator [Patescibacteria group bacterium]MCG2692906.1 response regulator [Candidatus Parcubacteria bacterium]